MGLYLVVFLSIQGPCWQTTWEKCEGLSCLWRISLDRWTRRQPAQHSTWPCLCKPTEVLLQWWADPEAPVVTFSQQMTPHNGGGPHGFKCQIQEWFIQLWCPLLRWICWVWWDSAHCRVWWQGPGHLHAEGEVWLWEGGDDWRWCHRSWGLPSSCKYTLFHTCNQLTIVMTPCTPTSPVVAVQGLWCLQGEIIDFTCLGVPSIGNYPCPLLWLSRSYFFVSHTCTHLYTPLHTPFFLDMIFLFSLF